MCPASITVRSLGPDDVPSAVALFNARFPHNQITERSFHRVVFGDAHYDPDSTLIAFDAGVLSGFACAVIGEPERETGECNGYVKAFLFAGEREDAGAALLGRICSFLSSRGVKRVQAGEYGGGPYFFPGVDLRYEDTVGFFETHGWRTTGTIQDMRIELSSWSLTDRDRARIEEVEGRGIAIKPFAPVMIPAMKVFVEQMQEKNWFREGWEDVWAKGRPAVVAFDSGGIIGYAEYRPSKAEGSFGPTEVLESRRERGIGSVLLLAAMLLLKETGARAATAHWVYPPELYTHRGWSTCRRYAVFGKTLGDG